MIDRIRKAFAYRKTEKEIYLETSRNEKLDDDLVLLEGAQGKNYNGNMFYLLKEIEENPLWINKRPIFVVRKDNIEKAKKLFAHYNFNKFILVERDSVEYAAYLAKSKYLFTDNSFPTYLVKREGQIYVNTWHGTPIKYLGISDLKNSISLPNVQKNFFMCDYALFPNEHTKDIFLKDYALENYMTGKYLMCDYPRNDVFHSRSIFDGNIKKIAYMPTWRGTGRTANQEKQTQEVIDFLHEIDRVLPSGKKFYVNLHFLVQNDIDFNEFQKVESFPRELETYDFLKECDLLITDYSSVMFDFSVSGKPVILYVYDKKEYEEEKGFYFPLEELPFPIAEDINSLINLIIHLKANKSNSFLESFHQYSSPTCCKDILNFVFNGDQTNITVLAPKWNGKVNLYVWGDYLGPDDQKKLLYSYLESIDKTKYNIMLGFRGKFTKGRVSFLNSLPDGVNLHGVVNGNEMTYFEKKSLKLRRFFKITSKSTKTKRIFEHQKKRLFGNMKIDYLVQYGLDAQYMTDTFVQMKCEKKMYILPVEVTGIQKLYGQFYFNEKIAKRFFQNVIDLRACDFRQRLYTSSEKINKYYNRAFDFKSMAFFVYKKNNYLTCSSLLLCKGREEIDFSRIQVKIDGLAVKASFSTQKGISIGRNKFLNLIKIYISEEQLVKMHTHNSIHLCMKDELGYGMIQRIRYGKDEDSLKTSSLKFFNNYGKSVYFRENDLGSLVLTVRDKNYTDSIAERVKLKIASMMRVLYKNKNIILLFEKNSAKYEESASVLYENLIDENYNNVYFIMDKNAREKYAHEIDIKYKKNIIDKFSFRHYLYFFACSTFLSSEGVGHAMEMSCYGRNIRKRFSEKTYNYVFLQHGVMYMISLDSTTRKLFRETPKKVKKYRVVVSSDLEAEHFIQLGKQKSEQIYKSGLCKFDRSKWNENADKIVIMPTWRPWEFDCEVQDIESTPYYQMILRILDAIPEKMKSHVIILPHPLVVDTFKRNHTALTQYLLKEDVKYDKVLENTKILITDYSSIAYDAFYRGSNVIFYWEELQKCLENYGKDAKLMLNMNNVFGDVCYNDKELNLCVERNYLSGQREKWKSNFKKIVEYHDGNNTKRLMMYLKKDHII